MPATPIVHKRYLVHSEWFKNWKRFVNFDYYSYSTPDPGPINTADLLKGEGIHVVCGDVVVV